MKHWIWRTKKEDPPWDIWERQYMKKMEVIHVYIYSFLLVENLRAYGVVIMMKRIRSRWDFSCWFLYCASTTTSFIPRYSISNLKKERERDQERGSSFERWTYILKKNHNRCFLFLHLIMHWYTYIYTSMLVVTVDWFSTMFVPGGWPEVYGAMVLKPREEEENRD